MEILYCKLFASSFNCLFKTVTDSFLAELVYLESIWFFWRLLFPSFFFLKNIKNRSTAIISQGLINLYYYGGNYMLIPNDAPCNVSSWWKQLMINWTWAPGVIQIEIQPWWLPLTIQPNQGDPRTPLLCISLISGTDLPLYTSVALPKLISVSGTCLDSSCSLVTTFRLYPDFYWTHCLFLYLL